MVQIADGWPEITYRYIEHYFWEPQHLLRTKLSGAATAARGESPVDVVYRRLRSQEVPLNYLLNLFLRVAPGSLRYASLAPFGIVRDELGLRSLSLRTPRDLEFIQPDVHLESETSRVFIEVKVGASLTLKQVDKYVRLHKQLDAATGCSKNAYVLLLLKQDAVKLGDVGEQFPVEDASNTLPLLLGTDADSMAFGATTWQSFAANLAHEFDARRGQHPDLDEILEMLVGDFLADLRTRGLLRWETDGQ